MAYAALTRRRQAVTRPPATNASPRTGLRAQVGKADPWLTPAGLSVRELRMSCVNFALGNLAFDRPAAGGCLFLTAFGLVRVPGIGRLTGPSAFRKRL